MKVKYEYARQIKKHTVPHTLMHAGQWVGGKREETGVVQTGPHLERKQKKHTIQ